jgi:probable phosphoglycerate mutase
VHLYLIRHGESLMNLPDWKESSIFDGGLTERGHRQAAAAAAWMYTHVLRPDVIYCSSLARTRETGAYFQQVYDIPLRYDDRIREIGNNLRDHSPVPDGLYMTYQEYWASQRPFASITNDLNGESMMQFRSRVGMFLHELLDKHRQDTVFVICHGFVIDMFFDMAYNVGPYRHCEVWTSNTGIVHFEYGRHPGQERWRLHYQNRVEHLRDIGGLGMTLNGGAENIARREETP